MKSSYISYISLNIHISSNIRA